MNHYRTSDGRKVSKAEIDRRIRNAKAEVLENMMIEKGFISCEECGRSTGEYLDCSHIKSVDKCQKDGESEKAWSVYNIRVLCRPCHREHDKM